MKKNFLFYFAEKGVYKRILFSDILYIKAFGDYVQIHLPLIPVTIHKTMKEMEDILPATDFFRCQRSFIVNINYIEKIENMEAVIGKNYIPISEDSKQDLLKKLNYINL